MKAVTVKSIGILDEVMQTEIHHTFGMEHYTDYVFKPRGDSKYSATIILEESTEVIRNIELRSASFPGLEFEIEDLDMESNNLCSYRFRDGKVIEKI